MYCANCGAEISANDAYCPYCGVMNPRAAEREYMEKLEDIREDTEKLGDESERQARSGIRRAGYLAIRVFIVVAVVIAGLFAVGFVMERKLSHSSAVDVKIEAAFKEKYFKMLDELYEAGDDSATADFMNEIGGVNGATILSQWKHYNYMHYYMDYREISMIPETELDDDFWNRTYPYVLYDAVELICQGGSSRTGMSEEEIQKVKEYGLSAEEICAEYFSLYRADIDEIYESSTDEGGYIYFSRIREWAEKTGGAKS